MPCDRTPKSKPSRKLVPTWTDVDGAPLTAYVTFPGADISNPENYVFKIGDIVQDFVGDGTFIRNSTLPGHKMHNGEIVRGTIWIDDGLYVFTHGIGYNKAYTSTTPMTVGGVLWANRKLAEQSDLRGPGASSALDREAIRFWRQNSGED